MYLYTCIHYLRPSDQLVNVNGALGLDWTENWTLIILSNAEFLNRNHFLSNWRVKPVLFNNATMAEIFHRWIRAHAAKTNGNNS